MVKKLDKDGVSGALLTDLSKTFDCLLHDLLIVKLAAYGFDYKYLTLIQIYLLNRQQITKVNNTYSTYSDIIFGVPQVSILCPFLFNLYICDMFYDISDRDIASYADDNTPYCSSFSLEKVIKKLEACTNNLFKWFHENHMKANADKYHLLVTTTKNAVSANIREFAKNNSNGEKLLGIKIDTKLLFENHVSSLCKKASQKLHALARIVNYMDLSKRKSLMKAFITSQFNYCPLIWMFNSRELSNRINRIHERALRLVYQDNSLSFAELLEKDNSVTIYRINLLVLAKEIFKLKNGLAPEIMKDRILLIIFVRRPLILREKM